MSPIEKILAQKIVAVVRLDDYSRAVEVARALVAGGIGVLEFTLTGQGALEAITATRNALGDTVCVGVGTVLTPDQAEAAYAAGAQFAVTPAVRRQLLVYARDGHLTETVDVARHGLITAYRLPFWHYTTPLEPRRGRDGDARRWVLLASYQFAA